MYSDIEHPVALVLVDPSGRGPRVPARLGYGRRDPFAVRLSFPGVIGPDDRELTWLLSREMLEAGLLAPIGDGDVRVTPTPSGLLRLRLRSGTAEAVLEAPLRAVERFLRACRECVPPGEERNACDWEQEWATLLGREYS